MALMLGWLVLLSQAVGTSSWVYHERDVIPLGIVRVTRYTHHEGGRLTASGHILRDADEGKACAVGRDWFRKYVSVRDEVWVDGFDQPCTVLDTMAVRNRRGLKQTHWVDIYITDRRRGLDFGIQKRLAYLIRH